VSRLTRLILLGVAVVILVVAFVVLRPNDDTPVADAPTATATPTVDAGPLLTGSGVVKIVVNKGDTVRFRIRAPRSLEVHIHGYDIKKDVKAGVTSNVSFKATIDGIFDIEFEDTGTQIASLRVNP
jgi:sRNA-binding carbon storage regulator CsrA